MGSVVSERQNRHDSVLIAILRVRLFGRRPRGRWSGGRRRGATVAGSAGDVSASANLLVPCVSAFQFVAGGHRATGSGHAARRSLLSALRLARIAKQRIPGHLGGLLVPRYTA